MKIDFQIHNHGVPTINVALLEPISFAIFLAARGIMNMGKPKEPEPGCGAYLGCLVVVVIVGGLIWYFGFRESWPFPWP